MSEEKPKEVTGIAFKAGNVDFYLTHSIDGPDYVHIEVRGEEFTIVDFEEVIKKYQLFKEGKLFPVKEGKSVAKSWKQRTEEIKSKQVAKAEAMVNAFRQKSFDKLQEDLEGESI